MLILKVCKAFDDAKIPYAIVGGYAVALHGAVRGTVDVDLVLSLSEGSLKAAEKALNSLNLQSRLPIDAEMVSKFRLEYIEERNLIAWTFQNLKNPAEVVDLILTHDLKKMKSIKMKFQGQELRVLSLPDLIEMKKKAGRPQDLADVKALESLLK